MKTQHILKTVAAIILISVLISASILFTSGYLIGINSKTNLEDNKHYGFGFTLSSNVSHKVVEDLIKRWRCNTLRSESNTRKIQISEISWYSIKISTQ